MAALTPRQELEAAIADNRSRWRLDPSDRVFAQLRWRGPTVEISYRPIVALDPQRPWLLDCGDSTTWWRSAQEAFSHLPEGAAYYLSE